jgi:hypothetical protein
VFAGELTSRNFQQPSGILNHEGNKARETRGYKMTKIQQATHNHKRVGAVVVLQSTGELAQVVTPISGDTFWVKAAELTELASNRVEKPSKKSRETSGTTHR